MEIKTEWNHQGPPIPLWFRLTLKRIDPRLVLQFIPPRMGTSRGVDPKLSPHGVWNICRQMKKSKLLHPVAVWSLTDMSGAYASPGPDTIRLIRTALALHRRNDMLRLENLFDQQITKWNQENVWSKSEDMFRRRTQVLTSLVCSRQWKNRVFFPKRNVA